MHGMTIRVPSREGAEFDCYLAKPESAVPVPAIVLVSAIYGVDEDIRAMADAFSARGYIAAAPDMFWRSVPGGLPRDDERAPQRAQPRMEVLTKGEADLADVLTALRKQPSFSGRAAVIGFCFGGPYALIAPKRLGYDAGIACHGTDMGAFIGELDGLQKPVSVLSGDKDVAAPAEVLEAYRDKATQMPNLYVHVFPGVLHGYMMRGNAKAYSPEAYAYSFERAVAVLETLRDF
jgi:carboxymethylenebutenolidase